VSAPPLAAEAISLIEKKTGTSIKLILVIYAILIVGAASSRDHAMIALKRVFSRLEAAPTRN
jgi:hypothetical protein